RRQVEEPDPPAGQPVVELADAVVVVVEEQLGLGERRVRVAGHRASPGRSAAGEPARSRWMSIFPACSGSAPISSASRGRIRETSQSMPTKSVKKRTSESVG